tara:strand:- start:316 stop:1062 length:747 start_codon:yes stop_codon:yes gene_type:complete
MELVKVGMTNGKLSPRNIWDIPAGKTCFAAKYCKAAAIRVNGKTKVIDGPDTIFRCYAASQEARLPNVYDKRANNLKLIKNALDKGNLVELIDKSISKNLLLTRIHSSGDFFCKEYLDAWLEVAANNPRNIFYAYSKTLNLFLNKSLPDNFYLTASYGGVYDSLIEEGHFNRVAYVVNTVEEAEEMGLPIDHDDSHCLMDGNYCLLVHNTQPKGSVASKAIQARKKAKQFVGYSESFKTSNNLSTLAS